MKKVARWITGIAILSAAVLLVVLKLVDESNKLEFADDVLGILIKGESFYNKIKEETPKKELGYEDLRKEDLKYVTNLEIGLRLRNCETLVDLERCRNLERLTIIDGYMKSVIDLGEYTAEQDYRSVFHELPPPPLSTEKIRQFETELEGILQECQKLKQLYILNIGETFSLDSLQFLNHGENLTGLGLYYLGDIDYSPVLECVNLKVLTLYDCDISELGQISRLEKLQILDLDYTKIEEAGDIVNLKNLETLYITGTPLAENEEELQRLREALPNLEIITDGSY